MYLLHCKEKISHGNIYVNDALDNGAKYIITDIYLDSFTNENNILLVNDASTFYVHNS